MFNKEILTVHKTFMDVSQQFNKYVEEKDEQNFIKTIKNTQKYF
jgi:prephenate dehydrogenase